MTDTGTKSTPTAPVWALIIGAVVVGALAFLLVMLLDEQVSAFALGAEGARPRLMMPLAFGNLAIAFAVWGVLRVLFRKAWRRSNTGAYVWLGVLLWATLTISALALVRGVNLARIAAEQAVAAAERTEQAAIDATVAAFPAPADAQLLAAAFREMQIWADPIKGLRQTIISRDPKGQWQTVCGQVSFTDGRWAGYVSRSAEGYLPRATLQQDGFDAARARTCKPIVDKYVGVEGIDMKAYVAESTALGCMDIDVAYWEAWKAYCHGRTVKPKD